MDTTPAAYAPGEQTSDGELDLAAEIRSSAMLFGFTLVVTGGVAAVAQAAVELLS